MRLASNTGLLASIQEKPPCPRTKSFVDLRCEVTSAPFMLRPYAGLYNPYSKSCSVLCNHPGDPGVKEHVQRNKDCCYLDGKSQHHTPSEDGDKEKNRTPHDIVTEDMFRRYAETDSRPLTPAPTLASGKSRGSRRCLTPDQPLNKTAIVLDLRRSHSQETLYYHGRTTSDTTGGQNTSPTNERSTLPSLNLSEGAHARLLKGPCQLLPSLASPLVLARRQVREPVSKTAKKTQLKSLSLGKPLKGKNKTPPSTQRAKTEKEASNEANDETTIDEGAGDGDGKRRGKRRKKGRNGGSDRLTSAGLAAQSQQDPETQIAGISTDSHNPSTRGSIAPSVDDDVLPVIKPAQTRRVIESFLDEDILKYLHREVDEDAIETEFDIKRRYVYEEALRTKPERSYGNEMQSLLKELKVPSMSLGDWLHVPRVFSRQSASFSLPLDSYALETLSPMNYAGRFVNLKKSKQLLYLTVLRKFREKGYRMPIKNIEEGLILMMGGMLTPEKAAQFRTIMEFDTYVEEKSIPDEIKLTVLGWKRSMDKAEDASSEPTLNYRTWCGLCAICERMYGRFPPRNLDPPDGIELSDFTMMENKLSVFKIHKGLVEIINTIRER